MECVSVMHIYLYRIWLWSAGVAQSQLRCIWCYRCSIVYYMHISIGGASSRWMYPTLKPAGGRVGPNHPHLSLILHRALRPGAVHPRVGFSALRNVRLMPYNTHFITRGVWRTSSHTPPHYTRRRHWEQPWTTKNLHLSHLLPTHYQQQKIQGLSLMHLLQILGPHYLHNTY